MRAAVFDVFGTLLDVYSVTRRAEEFFPGQGTRLAMLWREKQLEYSKLRALAGRYESFSRITRDALEYALDALQLPAANHLQPLLDEYRRLAPFVDVAPALAQLHKAGIELGVLSNGDSEMIETVLVTSGLHRYFDRILSADQAQTFKPAPSIYALGPRAFRRAPAEILFVSSNGWDVCGAAWYGYTAFWVNRLGLPRERLGVEPHGTGATLADAARFLSQSNDSVSVEITA